MPSAQRPPDQDDPDAKVTHISKAHKAIEAVVQKEMRKVGHRNPARIAKIMSMTSDILDDLKGAQLKKIADDPLRLRVAIISLADEPAKPDETQSTPVSVTRTTSSNKPVRVIGTATPIEKLSGEQMKAPLTETVETVDDDDTYYETLSTTEAGERLDTTRTTINQWIKDGYILALKGAKRGWRIPAAQIRRGNLPPALNLVIESFDDMESAWHFLVTPQLIDQDRVRPLELLFRGNVDLVLRLVESSKRDFL